MEKTHINSFVMEWHYLNNQFDNATLDSFRLMLTVTNDHYAKLVAQQADADILVLKDRTEPVHQNYLDGYSSWKSAIGFYKGSTNLMEGLLKELSSTKARNWDTAIMVEYDKGTPEHMTLLPNGHAPFQEGTMDERIAAVKTLGEALDLYPALATLKTAVDAYHTTLKNARDGQQAKEQLKDQASTDLEAARKAIAWMMYRNLGSLMDKFGEATDNILNYFEVSLIQYHGSKPPVVEEFFGPVAPLGTVSIKQGVSPNATLIITNTGTVPLLFCEAPDQATACTNGFTLAPGEVHQVKGSDLNDPANSFLNITNNDPNTEGSYNFEIITPA